jgi:hypothetical protein
MENRPRNQCRRHGARERLDAHRVQQRRAERAARGRKHHLLDGLPTVNELASTYRRAGSESTAFSMGRLDSSNSRRPRGFGFEVFDNGGAAGSFTHAARAAASSAWRSASRDRLRSSSSSYESTVRTCTRARPRASQVTPKRSSCSGVTVGAASADGRFAPGTPVAPAREPASASIGCASRHTVDVSAPSRDIISPALDVSSAVSSAGAGREAHAVERGEDRHPEIRKNDFRHEITSHLGTPLAR